MVAMGENQHNMKLQVLSPSLLMSVTCTTDGWKDFIQWLHADQHYGGGSVVDLSTEIFHVSTSYQKNLQSSMASLSSVTSWKVKTVLVNIDNQLAASSEAFPISRTSSSHPTGEGEYATSSNCGIF